MNKITEFYNDLLLFHLEEKVIISQECLAEIALHFEDIRETLNKKQAKLDREIVKCDYSLNLTINLGKFR